MAAGNAEGYSLVFSTASATYGLVQSWSETYSTQRAEAKGPDGHTIGVQEYETLYELTLTYLEAASPTGAPAIGTVFTFNTKPYLIDSIESTRTVDGFKEVVVTAKSYPNLVPVAS